ncbi:tyrosine-type recombinase/integrase [Priestia megaterium]
METKLQLGPEFTDLDLVISTHKGTPMNQRSISKDFYIVRDQLDLPKIRFYDLRHTHATLLLQLGENVKVISERLGHSSVNITLEIYAHVMPTCKKAPRITLAAL